MSSRITVSIETPVGALDATLSRVAIHRLDFSGVAPREPVPRSLAPLFTDLRKELDEYFSGRRRTFDLPLEPLPSGTAFQNLVWDALLDIPCGEVISYADLAVWAGRPKAIRAAASACAANRIPILIPCHRVVAKHGLGGYGGGLSVKKTLLALEHGE